MGTHPVYILAIAAYRTAERPWVLGGLNILLGYAHAAATAAPRYDDPAFRRHLHRWQFAELRRLAARPFQKLKRLLGIGTNHHDSARTGADRRGIGGAPAAHGRTGGGVIMSLMQAARTGRVSRRFHGLSTEGRAGLKGLSWAGFAQVVGLTIRLVSNVILARFLAPADYGLLGSAMAVLTTLDWLSDIGITPALVRNPAGRNRVT